MEDQNTQASKINAFDSNRTKQRTIFVVVHMLFTMYQTDRQLFNKKNVGNLVNLPSDIVKVSLR